VGEMFPPKPSPLAGGDVARLAVNSWRHRLIPLHQHSGCTRPDWSIVLKLVARLWHAWSVGVRLDASSRSAASRRHASQQEYQRWKINWPVSNERFAKKIGTEEWAIRVRWSDGVARGLTKSAGA